MRHVTLPAVLLVLLMLMEGLSVASSGEPVLQLTTFLERLMSVDHLAEPLAGKTQMASTWDRTGDNWDNADFKQIEGDRNVLLDVDGPGCVHRIFTGVLGKYVEGTNIKVFLDNASTPIFDMPVNKFFDDKYGPIPYPLVFHKTYPGILFPIPFAKHCRIELYSTAEKKNWGNYWQVTYTRYSKNTPVKTLTWPLSDEENKVLDQVCQTWLQAESTPPEAPYRWTLQKTIILKPDASAEVALADSGVISQLRLHASPGVPEVFGNVRIQMFWDGEKTPAVDVPIGYFFGNVATGYKDPYHSLLLGVDKDYAYCRFPMPFGRGSAVRFVNDSVDGVTLKLDVQVEKPGSDTSDLGRFHATLAETEVDKGMSNLEQLPRYGGKDTPVHKVLDLDGKRGKYVGVFLHVDWPWVRWWGEGDWLIWADEDGWPPAYHGTGTEEYFNSGWGRFDRKAVSGIIRELTMRPGHIGVYSFHLNDNFPFEKKMRVAVEIWPALVPREKIPHSYWRSTAYWYEFQ